MTIFDHGTGPYLKAMWGAAPCGLDLEERLHCIGDRLPLKSPAVHIESYTGFKHVGTSLVNTIVSYSREPEFSSEFYNLTNMPSLHGYTTVVLVLRSNSKVALETEFVKVKEAFYEIIDLPIQPLIIPSLKRSLEAQTNAFQISCQFFERYKQLYDNLNDRREVPLKPLRDGPLIIGIEEIFRDIGRPFNKDSYNFHLTNRVEGTYEGRRTSLSLLTSTGKSLSTSPSLYGVVLSSTTGDMCPTCDEEFCDPRRSYVSFLLTPELVTVLGSTLNPISIPSDMSLRIGHRFNPNAVGAHLVQLQMLPLEKKQEIVDTARRFGRVYSQEHRDELLALANQVINVC